MKKVVKLVLIDADNKYLLMYRSNHPTYGVDPDLPGGTLEGGETLLEALLREVQEETQIAVDASSVQQVYTGTDYSSHDTFYGLFIAKLDAHPEIVMSWEHSSYKWLERDDFLRTAKNAKDTYMHMVYRELANYSTKANN